jgi:DNA invertase Pin-like site-specific DNA recombinase
MRVSSQTQAKEGESLEFQRNLLLDYIKTHDLVLVGEYMDDGISGTKLQRDELQRMLNDCKEGKIDLIIFTKLDRFFRSVRHLMNTLDLLEKYGIEWNAIQEHHDNQTPTGKLALTIMGAFGEMEANMASVRVKDAFSNKISKGEWLNGRPPCGYMIKDKKAVPDPTTRGLIKGLFDEYKRHGNMTKLVTDHLKDDLPHSRKGMRDILKNRNYIGEAHGRKDYLDPIVDRETFEDVQRLLKMNISTSQRYEYIFTGLVFCPLCGKRMSGQTVRKKYQRYRCCQTSCDFNGLVSERKLEAYLIGSYKEELEKRYISLKSSQKKDNSQRIKTITRKMDRLKELYLNDLIDLEEYKKDLETYRNQLRNLEKPTETKVEQIEELLKMNVYEIYWTLGKTQKRRLWRSVIKSITLKDGAFVVEYL